MHDLRLIHTDLKPENILLVSSECMKLPDYKVLLCEPHAALVLIAVVCLYAVLKSCLFSKLKIGHNTYFTYTNTQHHLFHLKKIIIIISCFMILYCYCYTLSVSLAPSERWFLFQDSTQIKCYQAHRFW